MNDIPTPARDEIEDLLPWYANGRLGAAERKRVEAELGRDPDLVRRLELVREEMAAVIEANQAIGAPSGRAFERLMAGIDAEPKTASPITRVERGLIARLGGLIGGLRPRTLAYAAVAAAVVIVVQGTVLTGLVVDPGPTTYRTASQEVSPPTSGGTLLVAFAPDARLADISALLERHRASVVEGPRAGGYFRLRVDAGADPEALKAAAALIAAEKGLVIFAQVSP